MIDEKNFLILNAIYLKKMATAVTVAEVTGLDSDWVEQALSEAADQGIVLAMPTGYMLLEGGTSSVLAYYHQTYAETRQLQEAKDWYEAFEVINARFIGQVTEWQKSEGDERSERNLLKTAERLTRDMQQLLPWVPRYQGYIRRFERGLDLVDQGQRDYVCNPTIDSVHNIWFEFHEDILAVLGRPRDTT